MLWKELLYTLPTISYGLYVRKKLFWWFKLISKQCKDITSIRKIALQVNSKEKVFVEDVSIESSKMKLIFPLKYEFDDGIKVAQSLK